MLIVFFICYSFQLSDEVVKTYLLSLFPIMDQERGGWGGEK